MSVDIYETPDIPEELLERVWEETPRVRFLGGYAYEIPPVAPIHDALPDDTE